MMKKRYRAILPVLCASFLIMGISLQVNAASENCQVEDLAGLLTESEVSEIEELVEELEDKTGWDVMAVTTADAEGMSATYYAEKWFDDYTISDDGIICLIDMDNREITIRTFGEAIDKLTDSRIEKILDAGYDKITEDEYAETFEAMLGKVSKYAYRQITMVEILIAVALALAAGGITMGAIVGSYRLKFGGYKYPIEKNGSIKLNKKEDSFVNQFVTHRHIPKSNGNVGGGSSTHVGAGGRVSGGGSRKF